MQYTTRSLERAGTKDLGFPMADLLPFQTTTSRPRFKVEKLMRSRWPTGPRAPGVPRTTAFNWQNAWNLLHFGGCAVEKQPFCQNSKEG